MGQFTALAGVAALLLSTSVTAVNYTLADSYDSTNFFDEFSFFADSDPTHGFVRYLDAEAAEAASLASCKDDVVFLAVDNTTLHPPGGRPSVRVTSNKAYNTGLFIADISHMPGNACGVWPAFWTFGPDWPNGGEMDIIEGVSMQSSTAVTLHTSAGCTITNNGSASGTTLSSGDCNSNSGFDGCSQQTSDTSSFGDGFNAVEGGVYAMEWTTSAISVWFFPRSSIPADIIGGIPDPTSWTTPHARFVASGCDFSSHFKDQNIVFDTTMCGDWAYVICTSNYGKTFTTLTMRYQWQRVVVRHQVQRLGLHL